MYAYPAAARVSQQPAYPQQPAYARSRSTTVPRMPLAETEACHRGRAARPADRELPRDRAGGRCGLSALSALLGGAARRRQRGALGARAIRPSAACLPRAVRSAFALGSIPYRRAALLRDALRVHLPQTEALLRRSAIPQTAPPRPRSSSRALLATFAGPAYDAHMGGAPHGEPVLPHLRPPGDVLPSTSAPALGVRLVRRPRPPHVAVKQLSHALAVVNVFPDPPRPPTTPSPSSRRPPPPARPSRSTGSVSGARSVVVGGVTLLLRQSPSRPVAAAASSSAFGRGAR